VAKNFDRLYPNLENLKKFHSFNFEDIPSQSQGYYMKTNKSTTANH